MVYKFNYLEVVKVVNKDRLREIHGITATISGFSKDDDGRNVYSISLDNEECWCAYEEELETTGKFSEEKVYDGSSIRVSSKGEILSTNIVDPDEQDGT
jgi:hypothetical protein